ncbi:MAG: Gfo/Idh/MocA family oxidoreductase [Lentisphaerae bacterium]|nr:Gfo/Idh/MocA family oxidoreductase [Lentisphaerota bacterium]
MARETDSVFKTKKRIRLGIWGLGRGSSFYGACRALNIDVVAGCDYNEHMRTAFLNHNPGAFVTAEAAEFLKQDFDAVLLATFCPAHADDAIACLRAGFHVLSEVTSFHTMAEGVRLVEEVERSGLIYNLAENYPFSAANMWLKAKWDEGLFGELVYAEAEYVHEILTLSYTYIDGTPIIPGNQAHSWRSWINYHYYNTHSLGPMMYITGTRPTRVVSLPGAHRLPGYVMKGVSGMGAATPSLITMSNGGLVRNLMGPMTSDDGIARYWGTLGAARMAGRGLQLRLGGRGNSPMLEVNPTWPAFTGLAEKAGHGGGDFWELYYFARQILEGKSAPFDIYTAADCTIPGILAYRSQAENGRAFDVPDFRDHKQREAYRNDHYAQPRFDHREGLFPKSAANDPLALQFARTMRDLVDQGAVYRAYHDWTKVRDECANPANVVELCDKAIAVLPRLQQTQAIARQIVERYPGSEAARVLGEMLSYSDEPETSQPAYVQVLKRERTRLAKYVVTFHAAQAKQAKAQAKAKFSFSPFVTTWHLAGPLPRPAGGIAQAQPVRPLDRKLRWQLIDNTLPQGGVPTNFVNVHQLTGTKDGMVYVANRFKVSKSAPWTLCLGHDGGCRVFVDGQPTICQPKRVNPAEPDRSCVKLNLKKGAHAVVVALDLDRGQGWGIYFRWHKDAASEFPQRVGAG